MMKEHESGFRTYFISNPRLMAIHTQKIFGALKKLILKYLLHLYIKFLGFFRVEYSFDCKKIDSNQSFSSVIDVQLRIHVSPKRDIQG